MSFLIPFSALVAILVLQTAACAQSSGERLIVQRGQDFRVVQTETGGHFTELRNGMHYLEGGIWKETISEIVPTATGAVSSRGPHKLKLSNRLTPRNTVSITTTDGKTLSGSFSEIRYVDSATGKTVSLGRRKTSPIELLPPNRAIYRNISDGISADLLITYTSSGVESDVILREMPRSPESLGLEPETTTLQVLTEFSEHPPLTIERGSISVERSFKQHGPTSERSLIDDGIDLGEAVFAKGTAFWNRSNPYTDTAAVEYPVAKQLILEQSTTTLIESIDYLQCEALLRALPTTPAADPSVGFTIDYRVINSNKTASFNFNDETYWVQPDPVYTNAVGSFLLSGPVTIQPGAVIKYNRNASLVFSGSVAVLSGNSPIVFTAADDNSIGESVSPGTPVGKYATYAFLYNNSSVPGNNIQLTRCQFRYCQTAVRFTQNVGSSGVYNLTTCKFDNCITGVAGSSSFPVTLFNPSFSSTTTPTTGSLTTTSYSGSSYSTSPADGYNGVNQAGGGGESVPDTMGAIGPDYLVETVNHTILIYPRGGTTSIESSVLTTFFGVPSSDVVQDVRVLFDPISQRWYIAAIERAGSGKFLFAYSTSNDPRGLLVSTKWKVLLFNLASTANDTDFPCLGYDSNGIYCSYVSDSVTKKHSLIALNKRILFSGAGGYFTWLQNYDSGTAHRGVSAYPTVSPDPVNGDSFCYLLMKQSPVGTGGQISYRRFYWNNSSVLVPYASDTDWQPIPDNVVHYTDYLDLDNVTFGIPQPNGWPNSNLGRNGSKIGLPVLRNGIVAAVWTVGLQSSGSYSSGTVDRTGIQLMKLSVGTDGSLGIAGYGRVFSAGANPVWFNVPSVATNLRGDSIITFNGSNSTNALSCYYSTVTSGSSSPSSAVLFYSGTDGLADDFGDISATVVDPVSDLDVWSFQEWGDSSTGLGTWGTRVQKIHNP